MSLAVATVLGGSAWLAAHRPPEPIESVAPSPPSLFRWRAQDPAPSLRPADAPQNKPNYFNPQISLIADFRGVLAHDDPNERRGRLQEVEVGLVADIDPYLRGEVYLAWHNEDGHTHADVEEAFAKYNRFAPNTQLKVGKIAGAIGRVNRNHPDQLQFLGYPLVIQDLFGEEGLRAPGASASYLFPGERFHELTVEALDPEDGPVFMGGDLAKPTWVGRYRTFFDFSEDLSAQLGGSYANGQAVNGRASVYGADFTMKWQPGTKGKSAMLETEAYWCDPKVPGATKTFGMFAALTYEVLPRWFFTGKVDYSEIPATTDIHRAWSLGATFKLTEYQHWRLEYRRVTSNFAPAFGTLTLQFQFAMGPHPAHKY